MSAQYSNPHISLWPLRSRHLPMEVAPRRGRPVPKAAPSSMPSSMRASD